MTWVHTNIRWVMILSGVVTTTMIYAAIAPDRAMLSMFGEAVHGAAAHILVRNWGALIALVGAMLIYGAFFPQARAVVLVLASVSKTVFIVLVLSEGRRFLGQQAGLAAATDSVMVTAFLCYLVGAERIRRLHASTSSARGNDSPALRSRSS